MFGENAVTKPFQLADGALLVNEIFMTIQGEGPDAGCPAIFVRLAKCNLRCYFCDTEFERGEEMTLSEIVREVADAIKGFACDLMVITGGEPFLQNFGPLVETVNHWGMRVSVETAGTISPYPALLRHFERGCENKIICSPKTPAINPELEQFIVAFKYIITHNDKIGEDGLPLGSTQQPGGKPSRLFRPRTDFARDLIFLQPMDEQDSAFNSVNRGLAAELCMRHGYRISLQMHKLLGLR